MATTDFGLGIDCPDVGHVINYGLPSDVASYVQETGQETGGAGRGSLSSLATMPVEDVWKSPW